MKPTNQPSKQGIQLTHQEIFHKNRALQGAFMLLKDGVIGHTYVVQSIDLPTSIQRHLEALGMTYHTPLTVLNRKNPGIMIIQLRGSRYALGYSVTKSIEVVTLSDKIISVLPQSQFLPHHKLNCHSD